MQASITGLAISRRSETPADTIKNGTECASVFRLRGGNAIFGFLQRVVLTERDKYAYSPKVSTPVGRGIGVKLLQQIQRASEVVNNLADRIDGRRMSLREAEDEILDFANCVGGLMEQELVDQLCEPTIENRAFVEGKEAVYDGDRQTHFVNRFGGQTKLKRRGYKLKHESGCWYPLDEKLGLDRCKGFSPLMSYLLVLHGANKPFGESAETLSETLGFSLSATAVQANTESIGAQMSDDPYKTIEVEPGQVACDVMVVEVDGTTSPQISVKEGITGREGLKEHTEWKECNVVTIQKYREGNEIDCWIGARYGPREGFNQLVRRGALKMGQLYAHQEVFIADGLPNNWQIQADNFPEATCILDFYHASEHLNAYCKLFGDPEMVEKRYQRWYQMFLDGEVLQAIAEMTNSLPELTDSPKGAGQVRYFQKNIDRMSYDQYREAGFPIGSGKVEANCKFVIGKRFKGSGMRWKKADNIAVLKARLAKLNGQLKSHFRPQPRHWSLRQAA